MSLNRRDLLSLGAASALGAALPWREAAARAFAPSPIDAQLRVDAPTGGLDVPVSLIWLHDSGAEIPLWAAQMGAAHSPAPGAELDIPADRGVTLRLAVGDRTRELRLTRWGRFEWPVGPQARLAVELAPRAKEGIA